MQRTEESILSEGLTQHHRLDEIPEAAVLCLQFGQDAFNHLAVAKLKFAAQRVGEQFFSKALGKLITSADYEVAEFDRALKLVSAGQFSRSVDRISAVVFVSLGVDCIAVRLLELIERQNLH